MSNPRCRSNNPATCRYHGQPILDTANVSSEMAQHVIEVDLVEKTMKPGTVQHKTYLLIKNLNEQLKTELCEQGTVETVDNPSELTNGYSYSCPRCGKTHVFSAVDYQQSTPMKAISYLGKQLDPKHRPEYIGYLTTVLWQAADQSFTRHYKDDEAKKKNEDKLSKKFQNAIGNRPILNSIEVPSNSHTDWTSPVPMKENWVYIEPENVPKEILYKFSQCLRKKQHVTAEIAQASLEANNQTGKEVYACPHCKKYHYGRPIEPNRTEEQRYEFAKKTWAMPAYREAVNLVIRTHKLDKIS